MAARLRTALPDPVPTVSADRSAGTEPPADMDDDRDHEAIRRMIEAAYT